MALAARRKDRLEHSPPASASGAGPRWYWSPTSPTSSRRPTPSSGRSPSWAASTRSQQRRRDAARSRGGAPLSEWQRMVDLNVLGLLYCAHAALPHLLRAAEDGPRHVADMVNISSAAGRIARNGSAVYTLTKHGIGAFSESLRLELTHRHIRSRWSSPAPPPPNWPGTTGPRCSRACGASSPASADRGRGHRRRDRLHRDPATARRRQRDTDPPHRAGLRRQPARRARRRPGPARAFSPAPG